MRVALTFVLAVLAGCSGVKQRVGSTFPEGAHLTAGRVIEGKSCSWLFFNSDRVPAAYRELIKAAGRDYITDVEVRESSGCTHLRARAVKVAAGAVATPP